MKKQLVFLLCASLTFFAGADRVGHLGAHQISISPYSKTEPIILPSKDSISAVPQDPMIGAVKKKITAFMRRYNVPGVAVVLYVHGKSYLFHCGYADREAKIPVTQKTIFEIGSITKLFTCLLVAQEILDGSMCLTDSIRDYIPALAHNKRLKNMTLERLATHTSTIPYMRSDAINTKDKFLSYVSRWRMPSTSCLQYIYSNHGIELLRCALEQVSGESIQDLMIKRILLPLGMAPIGMHVPPLYLPYCAACYDKAGSKTIAWNKPLLLGSAALRASSVDMLAFLKASLGLPGTPTRIMQAMRLTQTPYVMLNYTSIGMGWSIRNAQLVARKKRSGLFQHAPVKRVKKNKQIFNPSALFDKTGTTEGFHAYIAAIPAQAKGIVVMMNRTLPKGWNVVSTFGKEILLHV
jgi:beta-lactamase class C